MDYKINIDNLDNYIENLPFYKEDELRLSDLIQIFLSKAKDKSCIIHEVGESFYIKKGNSAKVLFHINIDDKKENLAFKIQKDGEEVRLLARSSVNVLASLIGILYLLEYSSENFDVLISKNSLTNNNDYAPNTLKEILRTDNIINLNLKQADCIADEFSALKLFLNQVKVERFEPDYEYLTYRLCLDDLSGGQAGEQIDRVKLNAIKFILGLIRKIKASVDLDIISINAGSAYNYIPQNGSIDFIIKKEFKAELENIFEIVKNESIEKNLKYEPDMTISLKEIEGRKLKPITNESFNHLASFIELIPNGSVFVNSVDDQLVSSSNLALIKTLKNYINMIIVFRSLSEESMQAMIDKTQLAANISQSILSKRFEVGKWKNQDPSLKEIFIKTYKQIFGEDLRVVKTQYSLDGSMIFKDLKVKIISLGVKYKKGDSSYSTSLSDLAKVIKLLEKLLGNL
ncbi:MAG: hypothetical protein Q4D88_02585 [Anaerococcus sp.]|nr:hypothetical protein [Anaerococcus sp.]